MAPGRIEDRMIEVVSIYSGIVFRGISDSALQVSDDTERFGFAEMDGVADHLEVVTKKGLERGLTAPIEASEQDQRTVECIRGLVLDCCQQHGIGHGGILWKAFTLHHLG
jgi:hypothetical protein